MKWKKYTIKTTTAAEDFVSSALADLGIEGVLIEDNVPLSEADKEKMFVDILPDLPVDDGVAYVSFYLDAEEPEERRVALLGEVREVLEQLRPVTDVGEGSITEDETEDKDWVNNWKQYFTAFSIDDIYIRPSWEDAPVENAYSCVIEIDPGISFGTGKHETTQLCIRQLRGRLREGDAVLDVGCGSGILSIVAMKLGAGEVNGTDVDADCMDSVRANMERNGLLASMGSFYCGNLITDGELLEKVGKGHYDIVVANILADVLIPLAPVALDCLVPGGLFITSGIIDFKEGEVREAIEAAGFSVVDVTRQGEWSCVVAKRELCLDERNARTARLEAQELNGIGICD